MHSDLVDNQRKFVQAYFDKHLDNKCKYHNYTHTEGVLMAAEKLAEKANVTGENKENLLLAALYHDIGFCTNMEDHEKEGGKKAIEFLTKEGLSQSRTERINQLILATKLDWKGNDKMSLLLRDADLSGLAEKGYDKISNRLRKEKISIYGKEISKKEWNNTNIEFFEKHNYHTLEGQQLFNAGKQKNLQRLKGTNVKEKKDKKEDSLTIASSKSAQTQLKTSLRNHIDLSSIADNKANIMLSVNAIVITVGLPLLVDRMSDNESLMIPTAILAISSVISMIFATLSTRPIKMSGLTDLNVIPQKKSNLFFFGNFYKMNFDQYEQGIKTVVADNEIMDNSITRDLFFLGKSLGQKYDYLRICYNVFMIGIVLAVITFIVVTIFNI